MELDNRELEVHLVVFEDLKLVQIVERGEHRRDIRGDLSPMGLSLLDVQGRLLEDSPEAYHARTKAFNCLVEVAVELVH